MRARALKSRAFFPSLVTLLIVAGPHPSAAASPAAEFRFTIAHGGLTSAGVYTPTGRLVRVLWSMKKLEAGAQTAAWDGLDQMGQPAPPGNYRYRVEINGSVYRNVGAIGNDASPPDSAHHTPNAMLAVATDSTGAVYTANSWNEAGDDFKKWDAAGRPLYGARFQIRNLPPGGGPYAIAVDDQYLYCAVTGWRRSPGKEQYQQIQRFRLSDGTHAPFTGVGRPDGNINVYELVDDQIAKDDPDREKRLLPLRALAVKGDALFAADALDNRILSYDRETGAAAGSFPISLPQAITVDAGGLLVVGHGHHNVSLFSTSGHQQAHLLSDVQEITALAVGPDHLLYVADGGAGRVKIYQVRHGHAQLVRTFGHPARSGESSPDAFYELNGVTASADGSFVTLNRMPTGGSRMARWSPRGQLLWEHMGLEFMAGGNYGSADPTRFYSTSLNAYHLLRPEAGTWRFDGPRSPIPAPAARYHSDPHGSPRVVKLNGISFWYNPTGDGVQVYRILDRTFRLAALVGGKSPGAEGNPSPSDKSIPYLPGLWTWSDVSGRGEVRAADIHWNKKPGEARYATFGQSVDQEGNIWFANLHPHSIWELPRTGLDRRGNPTYDWSKQLERVPRDDSPLGFDPTAVRHSSDGSIYAFGWSKRWPPPANNPFWMGGTTLTRFDASGKLLWAVELPEICVGMDLDPAGRGLFVGGGKSAAIYHYTKEGLLIGKAAPGKAMGKQSGWLDNQSSVSVNRDPRDGVLDVFVEDDYVLRLGWYRVDDRHVEIVEGRVGSPRSAAAPVSSAAAQRPD